VSVAVVSEALPLRPDSGSTAPSSRGCATATTEVRHRVRHLLFLVLKPPFPQMLTMEFLSFILVVPRLSFMQSENSDLCGSLTTLSEASRSAAVSSRQLWSGRPLVSFSPPPGWQAPTRPPFDTPMISDPECTFGVACDPLWFASRQSSGWVLSLAPSEQKGCETN